MVEAGAKDIRAITRADQTRGQAETTPMAEETALWPVNLQPWNNGRRFAVKGLPPRFSAWFGRWVIPTATFTSDLTSSPMWAQVIVPLWGLWGMAALYHDLLYRHKLPGITRKMADQIMREFMEEDRVGRIRRYLIYAAVRVGGGKSWNEHS